MTSYLILLSKCVKPKAYKLYLPTVFIGSDALKFIKESKYLGFTFSDSKSDDCDMLRQTRLLYAKSNKLLRSCQLGPRYEGQLTRMAEPIPPSGQSSSYSLTTLSSSSSTDRRAETDRKVITTRIAVAQHFICRLRRRESCILGATSSQPTLPLHELPPARLVIHRQTSNHERRKGTLSVQSRSGILADFCPRQH